jgi:hypothetical protein
MKFDLRSLLGWAAGNGSSLAFKFGPYYGSYPREYLHHIVVYSCSENEFNSMPSGPVMNGLNCQGGIVFVWGIGGLDYCLPPRHAFRLNSVSPYVQLELHMDNPHLRSGVYTDAGFFFDIMPASAATSAVFTKEVNWAMTGSRQNLIRIPPRLKRYELRSSLSFPHNNGASLQIVGTFSHMHGYGRKIWLEVIRSSGSHSLVAW